jgi:nucleoside-diphosphate kinase
LATERTFAIIKPDAVKRGLTGEILSRIHAAKFQIVAIKSLRLTKTEAEGFYAVHRERPFFGELTEFMSSGKAVVMVLEAENAILKWRETMGAILPRPPREQSARHLARASNSIARTAPTRRILRLSKSVIFSLDRS